MIAFNRSATIAPGKLASTLAFAREVAAHITTTTGTEVSVAVPVGGNPSRISWSTRHESLADFDAVMMALMADAAYAALMAKNADNFIPGSVHDDIWRVI
ncbi:MAG: hypothetical protein ABI468_00675 [Candidatus Nanopelagicales bacterium]